MRQADRKKIRNRMWRRGRLEISSGVSSSVVWSNDPFLSMKAGHFLQCINFWRTILPAIWCQSRSMKSGTSTGTLFGSCAGKRPFRHVHSLRVLPPFLHGQLRWWVYSNLTEERLLTDQQYLPYHLTVSWNRKTQNSHLFPNNMYRTVTYLGLLELRARN